MEVDPKPELLGPEEPSLARFHPHRRAFMAGALALVGGVTLGWRLFAFPLLHHLNGQTVPRERKTLSTTEWITLLHVFESLSGESDPKELQEAALRVDEFLTHFSFKERMELGGALFLLEQVLAGGFCRFSSLSLPDRNQVFEKLRESGGVKREVYIGLKELTALAFYTGDSRWSEIGYPGPMVSAVPDSPSPERENLLKFDVTLARYWGKE